MQCGIANSHLVMFHCSCLSAGWSFTLSLWMCERGQELRVRWQQDYSHHLSITGCRPKNTQSLLHLVSTFFADEYLHAEWHHNYFNFSSSDFLFLISVLPLFMSLDNMIALFIFHSAVGAPKQPRLGRDYLLDVVPSLFNCRLILPTPHFENFSSCATALFLCLAWFHLVSDLWCVTFCFLVLFFYTLVSHFLFSGFLFLIYDFCFFYS